MRATRWPGTTWERSDNQGHDNGDAAHWASTDPPLAGGNALAAEHANVNWCADADPFLVGGNAFAAGHAHGNGCADADPLLVGGIAFAAENANADK